MTAQKITFEADNYDRMIKAIRGSQHPQSIVSQGERLAAMVLSKSQKELTRIFTAGDAETNDKLVEALAEAEAIMRARLQLIESALARIIVVDDPELNGANSSPPS